MTSLLISGLSMFVVLGSRAFVAFQYQSGKIDRIKCRKRIGALNTAGVFLLLIAVGIIHNSEFNY